MTTAEAKAPVVAIGDVHGCASLLREAIWPHLDSGAELILLGDLIDRSPEPDGDRQVIELVRELDANPEAYGLAGVTVLRGNHEQMLIEALAEDSSGEATELWEWNGGDTGFLPVAREHRGWLESLPLTAVRGNYLFVHAGVRPGVPLQEQRSEDLLWIRGPFLKEPHGLPYTVVHGHTFRADFRITHLPHRVGIDTGAFQSGLLTALPVWPNF
jgi:serine/threonine protein phosphatase 1